MRLRAKKPSAARFTRVSPGTVEAAVQHVLNNMPAAQVKPARPPVAAIAASLDTVSRDYERPILSPFHGRRLPSGCMGRAPASKSTLTSL